jgi:nitrite reductase/ring-hydroxylating ferredoxin subunit
MILFYFCNKPWKKIMAEDYNWKIIYDFETDGQEPQKLNTVRTVQVDDKLLCLARLEEGYFAVDDRCPHAGGRLGLGKCGHDGYVTCPVHRYRYNLKTGRGLPQQGDYVETYPVKVMKDGVYVGFVKKKWWKLF